jgi:hypothetical protein
VLHNKKSVIGNIFEIPTSLPWSARWLHVALAVGKLTNFGLLAGSSTHWDMAAAMGASLSRRSGGACLSFTKCCLPFGA